MSDLVLSSIRKSFGTVDVIHGVDLTVTDGEFVVFVGPSGCGKSTLLRIIAGLEASTSGDILLDGRRVNDVAAADRGLAMVFQSYALYPHMSVRQNLSFGLENARMSKAEITQRVGEAARMLRIEELLERKPRQLSGGQRQRVAIGRAIVRRPGIFLLDEPLSNLDAELRVAMRGELASLHKRLAATMIYVTHDQVEAMTMADRIVVLRGGRVEQIGPPLELYNRPANRFVAGFLGAPRMNFLAARPAGRDLILADGTRVPVAVDLAPVAGQDVTLGIRPQHLRPADGGGIPATATLVEQLGSETVVHARSDALGALIVAVPGQVRLADGETVHLAFDPADAHVFGPDDRALPHVETAGA
jgi:multiple sugar transport system ATP-binding protein